MTDSDLLRLTGAQFQGWTLLHSLGKGLDGIVYLAQKDDERAALKLFFPEAIKANGEDQSIARIDLQLTLCGAKRHPNLVEIYSGGRDEESGLLFIIMEYVEGDSLDKVVDKIPRENLSTLFNQLCSAAYFLETQKLYHRDIKPANIVISRDCSTLTLLDLGIVFQLDDEVGERLSGDEFVASLRYSPPEFVWREEDGADPEAWRAITFYQIGATLHDMIMQRQLFTGHDRPRVKLYECVKLRIPVIESADCPGRLIKIARYCLVKNWRERLRLLSWDAILGNQEEEALNVWQRHSEIRLRQIHRIESDNMKSLVSSKEIDEGPVKQLWHLQSALFMEIREYLMSDVIFPKFSATHDSEGDGYLLRFKFEQDDDRLFNEPITVVILIRPAGGIDGLLSLEFKAVSTTGEQQVFGSAWTEAFTIETAAATCQNALLQVADKVTLSA